MSFVFGNDSSFWIKLASVEPNTFTVYGNNNTFTLTNLKSSNGLELSYKFVENKFFQKLFRKLST